MKLAAGRKLPAAVPPPTTPGPIAAWPLVLRRIEPRKTYDETVRTLLDAIKLGALPPGSRLPHEGELLKALRVSRATLRESFAALRRAGYVKSIRGRTGGTVVVARVDEVASRQARRDLRSRRSRLLDAMHFRRIVEPAAAELAAERATRADTAPLYGILNQLRASDSAGDYRRLHAQLHLGVAYLSKSPLLLSAVTQVIVALHDALLAAPQLQSAIRNTDENHRRIIDAIAEGDRERAREQMTKNVRASERILAAVLAGESPDRTKAPAAPGETHRRVSSRGRQGRQNRTDLAV